MGGKPAPLGLLEDVNINGRMFCLYLSPSPPFLLGREKGGRDLLLHLPSQPSTDMRVCGAEKGGEIE